MARRGISAKTLKKMLKKKGLKTTGKKATLTRRAKKARLIKGGIWPFETKPRQGRCDENGQRGPCRPVTDTCPDGKSTPAYSPDCN